MDETRLKNIEDRLEQVYKSVEKTRKYFLWSVVTTLLFFLLPLIASIMFLPMLMQGLNGLGIDGGITGLGF